MQEWQSTYSLLIKTSPGLYQCKDSKPGIHRGPRDGSLSFWEQLTSWRGRNLDHTEISCHFNCIRSTGGFVIPCDRVFSPESHCELSSVAIVLDISCTRVTAQHTDPESLINSLFSLTPGIDPSLLSSTTDLLLPSLSKHKKRSKSVAEKELKSSAPSD